METRSKRRSYEHMIATLDLPNKIQMCINQYGLVSEECKKLIAQHYQPFHSLLFIGFFTLLTKHHIPNLVKLIIEIFAAIDKQIANASFKQYKQLALEPILNNVLLALTCLAEKDNLTSSNIQFLISLPIVHLQDQHSKLANEINLIIRYFNFDSKIQQAIRLAYARQPEKISDHSIQAILAELIKHPFYIALDQLRLPHSDKTKLFEYLYAAPEKIIALCDYFEKLIIKNLYDKQIYTLIMALAFLEVDDPAKDYLTAIYAIDINSYQNDLRTPLQLNKKIQDVTDYKLQTIYDKPKFNFSLLSSTQDDTPANNTNNTNTQASSLAAMLPCKIL